jgi:hypothetical protein
MDEADLTYKMDMIMDKCKINKSAFYRILSLSDIKDEKIKFKVLNYFVNAKPEQLKELAETMTRIKNTERS